MDKKEIIEKFVQHCNSEVWIECDGNDGMCTETMTNGSAGEEDAARVFYAYGWRINENGYPVCPNCIKNKTTI